MSHKSIGRNSDGLYDGLVSNEQWIERMEGELDPSLAKDLDQLTLNSKIDRERLDRLWQTRKLIKESDDVALPEDGRFYDSLQAKIMAAIETVEAAAPSENDEKSSAIESDEADGSEPDHSRMSMDDANMDDASMDDAKMSWTLVLLALARRWNPREFIRM